MSAHSARGGRPRSWRRGVRGARPVPADSREAAEVERDEVERLAALAVRFGWCGVCGDVVDEANGKLHAAHCAVGAERKVES